MKKLLSAFLSLILLFSLTGCFSYREVDRLSIVAGLAVDRTEDGQLLLTAQIMDFSPSTEESKAESKTVSAVGKTVFEAIRNMIEYTGQRLYWSHAHIVIIGEDAAKEGLLNILDWLLRDEEARLYMKLLVSKGQAKDIFECEPVSKTVTSVEINEKLTNGSYVSTFHSMELYQVVNLLRNDGVQLTLPAIQAVEENGEKLAKVSGCAYFDDDKLAGFLDGEETFDLLFLQNQVDGGILAKKQIGENDEANVSLEIKESTTFYDVSDGPSIKITVNTDVSIGETATTQNYISSPGREELQSEMEAYLEQRLTRMVERIQKELKLDISGFGEATRLLNLSQWQKYKDDWQSTFEQMNVEVECHINLLNSSHAIQPLEQKR